ncbi:MAG: hypothetical protein ACLU4N_00670 [Butyricimonas faecihominis]
MMNTAQKIQFEREFAQMKPPGYMNPAGDEYFKDERHGKYTTEPKRKLPNWEKLTRTGLKRYSEQPSPSNIISACPEVLKKHNITLP